MSQRSLSSHLPDLFRRLMPALACGAVYALAACTATRAAPDSSSVVRPGRMEFGYWHEVNPDTLREPMVLSSVPIVVGSDTIGRVVDVRMTVDTATMAVPKALAVDTSVQDVRVRAGISVADTLFTVSVLTDTLRLRAYRVTSVNGSPWPDSAPHFPGPSFRVSPGDFVRIRLVNNLPAAGSNTSCVNYAAADSSIDKFEDCFHGSNWTNIHYHGFHVTPDPPADDVLLQIAPGDSFQYNFRIPMNQSPGTHWYHPHKHGSVALQVTNGMSGAFFVTNPAGGLDSLVSANGWRERLLALQQVSDTINLMTQTPVAAPVTLVNGQFRPTLRMRPGEVQRWRIVDENITSSAMFSVGFVDGAGEEPAVYDVARDGVQYASANYSTSSGEIQPDTMLLVAAGSRLDVLIQAPSIPGRHLFQAQSVHPNAGSGQFRVAGANGGRGQANRKGLPPNILFLLEVAGDSVPQQLPATLPALPSFLSNLTATPDTSLLVANTTLPVIVFSDSFSPGSPSSPSRFFLGNAQNPFMRFNSSAVYVPTDTTGTQRPMTLDSVQVWRVENRGTATNHPFHIHINPFQVLYVQAPSATDPFAPLYQQLNAAAQDGAPIWLDVLPLPLSANGQPGVVYIAQKYADFDGCQECGDPAGWFVMHCHILGHEERGMMQVLQIIRRDTIAPPPASLLTPGPAGGASHQH